MFQMPMMGGRICIHGLIRQKEMSKISNAHDWWSVTPRAAEAEARLHVGFNLDLDGLRLTWVIQCNYMYIVKYIMIDIHSSLWSSIWLVGWF